MVLNGYAGQRDSYYEEKDRGYRYSGHHRRYAPGTLLVYRRPRSYWSMRPGEYTPLMWGIPESEKRRRKAETLYELEKMFREDDWFSSGEYFIYDAERDLYRFPDGEFAFSREYANERRLREEGFTG